MALSTARSRDILESWVEDPFRPTAQDISNQLTSAHMDSMPVEKPCIIGLYGISGSGKSYHLDKLRREWRHNHRVAYYEGTDEILKCMNDGRDNEFDSNDQARSGRRRLTVSDFQALDASSKAELRKAAVNSIVERSKQQNQHAIVTGHFMFWSEHDTDGTTVCTAADLRSFTNIIYLDPSEDEIFERREAHTARVREPASSAHLLRWKEKEIAELRSLCLEHNILFSTLSTTNDHESLCSMLNFHLQTEAENNGQVSTKIDANFCNPRQPQVVLILDADKTLAPFDSGALFWSNLSLGQADAARSQPSAVDALFSHPKWGYSYDSFRQAALMYEAAAGSPAFDTACEETARQITLFPEIQDLLQMCTRSSHVGAVVITCGLQLIWEKVLARAGLAQNVPVIGTCRIANGYTVTPSSKARAVKHLQEQHKMSVWAFGDSPLDLPMLRAADKAIVVVMDEEHRSRSMETRLSEHVTTPQWSQWLLPSGVKPRLDLDRLPLIDDVHGMLRDLPHLCVYHATGTAIAKLLQTPMRDQRVMGVDLQQAHQLTGRYLAMTYLPDIVGVIQQHVPHVQGTTTEGYLFDGENSTTIVAMMRGGLSMALGVQDVMRNARLCFAKTADELTADHLEGQATVLLVDSVVNSGKSIVEFVHHIRHIRASSRIIVIAGVVQADALCRGGPMQRLAMEGMITIIALRISENKYTGTGGIDTGNRLFRTTHMA